MKDKHYTAIAMKLAKKAKGLTSPNPMVGAVIVKNNKIIAQGYHRRCGTDHAEVIALKKAGKSAKGSKLYVTLEPCFHQGMTPPCVDKIINSGIKEVIIGVKDPNKLTNGKSINKLKRAGIKVKVGLLENELEELNEVFIKYIKMKMPFVVAKCAQTLDGKIATFNGRSKWITSSQTRKFAKGKRNEFDAILVGISTVLSDDPSLNNSNKLKPIKKIVVDSKLKISLRAKLFKGTKPSDCIIATTKKASERKINELKRKGVCVIICREKDGMVNLKCLFKELAKKEITSILIEGGAKVIGSALKEGLVDKMHIYIAPKIIGDKNALSSVVGLKTRSLSKSIILKNLNFEKINKEVLIKAYVLRNS